MSSYFSDFEHTRMNAHVFPDFVVETHIVSDPNTGARRVPVSKAWKVERVLGKGGYGEVRLEVNEETNEKRAVKRIWTSGSKLKKECERELKALLEFSKGKYKEAAVFVGFLGWFEDRESVHLAMEYVPLGDLENNVPPKPGVMKETEIRAIAQQILEDLKIMHLESFVHRDLQPKARHLCHYVANPH
jgi:serine/threonine protein kinase